MSTQPTQPAALELADWLEFAATSADMGRKPQASEPRRKAAAELRRLHALTTKQGTQPTPEDLEALLLAQHPASKHYLPAVKAKIVAAMQAAVSRWGTPATGGEPVAWIRFQPPYQPDVYVQRHRPKLEGEPDTQYRPLVFGDTSTQPVREPHPDTKRLAWMADGWTPGHEPMYVQHVLSTGGTGDLEDMRTFIDKQMAEGVTGGQHGTE